MNDTKLLSHVTNYDPSHPKWICDRAALKWLWLFVYDFAFSATKQTDKSGDDLRKAENPSWIGRQFKAAYQQSIDSLVKRHAHINYSTPLPIPSIEASHFNRKFFKHWKSKINMPIVIKGFLNGAPIMVELSIEGLVRNYGGKTVRCLKNATDKVGVGQNLQLQATSLEEFLTSADYKDYYINNFHGILDEGDFYAKSKGKELEQMEGKRNFLAQWFISRQINSGSTLHCAPGDNMFLNIKGRKEWFFIDRTYTPLMQPILSKYAVYAVSELYERMHGEFYEDMLKNHPYVRHIPIYRCVLEEGDVLFNPPFWWHRVRNLTGYTVGCATRYWATIEAANSLAFTLCLFFDALRHPTKSVLPKTTMSIISKKTRAGYIESIFSKKQ